MHASLPVPAPLFILSIITLAVVIRFVVDRLDRQRIRQDVDARGGEVDDITWKPFGRGWFGEKSDRVYENARLRAEVERLKRRGA